jgi:metal-responsive CopG/Arc/MetJ family transcriptional regulator
MAKARKTVTLDKRVLRALRARAAKSGRSESEVIEDALRREFGLDLFDRIWARADLDEDEAMRIAVEEQHRARRALRA